MAIKNYKNLSHKSQQMKSFSAIASSIVLLVGSLYATPSIAGDPDDLVELKTPGTSTPVNFRHVRGSCGVVGWVQ